jgi:hypothetical protein
LAVPPNEILMDEEPVTRSGRDDNDDDSQKPGVTQVLQDQREGKKKAEKQRKPVKILRPEDFSNPETGLRLLYKEIRKKNDKLCKLAEIQPEKALQEYMSSVKEWAFSVAPKYDFDYFIDRAQTLGKKKELGEELKTMRRYHRGEIDYDKENKQYVPRLDPNQPYKLVLEEGQKPIPQEVLVSKPAASIEAAADYDPANDPDRGLDTLIDKSDLDYSIKKKVKLNEGSAKSSTKKGMDIEGL